MNPKRPMHYQPTKRWEDAYHGSNDVDKLREMFRKRLYKWPPHPKLALLLTT